jgi:hypothetical protein
VSLLAYTDFLTRMGHRVVTVDTTTWFDVAPRVFMPLPFDREINPQSFDWQALFAQGCTAARCLVAPPYGRPSYVLAIEGREYGLHSLESKARNQTRRGLEACEVRPVSFAELGTHGIALQRDTLLRQRRRVRSDLRAYWSRYFEHAAHTEGALAWGAFHEKQLAAYLLAFQVEDTAHVVIVRSAAALLRYYPNNALLFTFLRHVLGSGAARRVSIGFEPFQTNLASLDRFKEGLGFRRFAVCQYVRLAPPLPALLRRPLLAGSIACLRLLSRNETASKVAGLLECYATQKT